MLFQCLKSGDNHMNNIRKLTEIAEKNRAIHGSNEKEETSQSYIIEIPQNQDFEGYCLILCIILGKALEYSLGRL